MRGARQAGFDGSDLAAGSSNKGRRKRLSRDAKMQARSRKLAACQTGIWNKSQLTVTRDNLKIQHFGDNNVQNAIVREVRFLGTKTRLAFHSRASQAGRLLHLALGVILNLLAL